MRSQSMYGDRGFSGDRGSTGFTGSRGSSSSPLAYPEDFETQQRSRDISTYRGIKLRNMGASAQDTAKLKQVIDHVLDKSSMAADFRRKVREIDYARVLRHADGSCPTGFQGRGRRTGGGVISLRTANTTTGLYRTLAHELGHAVRGRSEKAAESYALDKGVFGENLQSKRRF